MLNLSVFHFCDVFVASFIYVLIIVMFIYGSDYEWGWKRFAYSSVHTYVHLHSISSIPELRPFRKKCCLRSCEIIISAVASQTLSEFMVLITSWGNNLRTVIGKCSHSNQIFSV